MAKSTYIPGKKKKNIRKNIYLDYASSALFGSSNPGAIHRLGVEEKNKLENSRTKVARILGARKGEIIFTSGATESNNLAILGLIANFKQYSKLPHIITTNIEHASVLEVCRHLEKTKQAKVTYIKAEENGIVDPKKIRKAFTKDTILVSVMYANNEIGTIQPIKEIAKEVRHYKKRKGGFLKYAKNLSLPIFHTDATQAINYLPVNAEKLGVDLMSFNGAKIYGPKGVGILYVKKPASITKIMFGGDQEMGLRPGTENIPGAAALASALETTERIKEREILRLTGLRDYFLKQLLNLPFKIKLNGDFENRLPNNINITIPDIPSDLLVIELSDKGIMASGKSACKSGDGKASHVIQAIDKNAKDTDGSLRFSMGRETTKSDIDYTVKALSQILLKLKRWYN